MPTTIPTTTSSTRPGSPSAGDAYFETDTKNYIIYDGTNWRGYVSDGVFGWTGSSAYSISFDGTNDYVNLASVVTPTAQQGTISAWVKSSSSSYSPILNISSNTAGHNNYWMGLQFSGASPGKLQFAHRPNAGDFILYTSASTYNDGNWHHVMVTSNGSSYKLFIDGSEDTSAITSGTNPSNVVGGWIGDMVVKNSCNIGAQRRNADGSNGYMTGNIDEVAVWDSDESSNISTIYNSGTPGNLSSLTPEHWYRMGDNNGGSGNTLLDQGSIAINGTLTNSPAYSIDTPPS